MGEARRCFLVLLCFWGLSPLAPAADKCQKIDETIARHPLLPSAEIDVILGDVKISMAMGSRALSYLATAAHLSGEQKSELWQEFRKRIMVLTKKPFHSDKLASAPLGFHVYRGAVGHLLVIDLKTGQMYRGFLAPEELPEGWTIEQGVREIC